MFASDNWAGVAPEVMEAIASEGTLTAPAYGGSETDELARARLREVFETDVECFFVATGTAANSLGLAACTRPGGLVLCHSESHISVDECGSVAFQGDGMRLQIVNGSHGKIDADDLSRKIAFIEASRVACGPAAAISLTQATEAGTLYSLEAIRSITEIAQKHGLPVHMDGARFANAIARLGVSPAEMTWKAGINMLSFGGTKNGCLAAEVLVVFEKERARDLDFRQMRAGHLASKSRFLAAQFNAYLEGDLWLRLARHANAMADKLRSAVAASQWARLAWPSDINEVFAIFDKDRLSAMQREGLVCGPWDTPTDFQGEIGSNEQLIRLVTSFATTDQEIEAFEDHVTRP